MSYRALTAWLLISAPSDVPREHLETVRSAISRWNVHYGRTFQATIVPVAWTDHAVAAFGDRPQGLLNQQLVNQADMGIALFRDRLGTVTGVAPSGTWEEVQRLAAEGKAVGILRDRTPRPSPSRAQAEEIIRLEEHFETSAYDRALILSFENGAQLANHVDAFINRAMSQLQQRVDDDLTSRQYFETVTAAGERPSRQVREIWVHQPPRIRAVVFGHGSSRRNDLRPTAAAGCGPSAIGTSCFPTRREVPYATSAMSTFSKTAPSSTFRGSRSQSESCRPAARLDCPCC